MSNRLARTVAVGCACLVWIGLQPSGGHTAELTLDDLIRMALARNPGIAAARQVVHVEKRGRDVAQRQRFPRFDIEAGYLGAYPDEKRLIPRTLLRDRPELSDKFAHHILTGSIALRVPIYTGGRLRAQVALGELATRLAQNALAQTRNDLIFNVSSTYYTILRLQEDVKATRASVEALEAARRNVDALVRAGRAAQIERFKVTTRLAAVRQALVRTQTALDLAHAGLNTLLGLDDVTQRLALAAPPAEASAPVDLHTSLETALQQRPALQIARRQVAIQEQQVRIAEAERLPQVQVKARYLGAVDPDNVSPIPDDGSVEVVLSQPLFTSGVISARIARERARLEQRRHELAQRRLEVTLEVERAVLNVQEALQRRRAAEAARDEAREVLRIEQLKLKVGKGRTEDLLIAQAAQLEAEANFFRALADARIAGVELRRATGVLPAYAQNP